MSSAHSSALPEVNRVAVGETIAVLFCPAPNGKIAAVTIDREDLERVQAQGFWKVANFHAFCGRFDLYCYTIRGGKNVYLHRFITSAPKGRVVDHIHHRNLDNRKTELRVCSQSLNQINRKIADWGKFGRGVRRGKNGKFKAVIAFNGIRHYLGTFDFPWQARKEVDRFLVANGASYAAGATA